MVKVFPIATVVMALLLAGAPPPAAQDQQSSAPLSKNEVIQLLKSGMESAEIERVARKYGTSFEVTPGTEKELRDAGATEALLTALRESSPKPPAAKPSPATAAPAPPAAGPPILVIEAKPGGAQVYVDDEPVGKTSSEGKLRLSTLSPKKHHLRLSLEGYKDHEQSIELAGGETVRLVVSLDAEPATRGRSLMAQAFEAMGGTVLRELRAVGGESTFIFQTPQGSTTMTRGTLLVLPNPATGESARAWFEFRMKEGKTVVALDGRGGWVQTSQGVTDLTPAQLSNWRMQIGNWIFATLQRFDRGDLTAQFVEQQQWEAKPVNVVRLSDKAGGSVRLVIDEKTSLVLKHIHLGKSSADEPVEVEEIYQDFRDVNGLHVPFKVTFLQNGKPSSEAIVQRWVMNPPVDPGLFVKPR